ncbi:DUF2384 domain-containing protein [Pseudomonas sp. Fl4BN1]|nr:antitoxin Xre/MbcA/ParS toxin-binding domain-containing protein [Pseudomonas sp. Fl4BN1]NBF08150.1 DUF2384 domain-containing protein [Pseudomonas sp. Fl4BN1]
MEFLEQLRDQAERVFGDQTSGAVWLRCPRSYFDVLSALEFVQDEATYLRAKEILNRIEHGFVC